MSFFAASISERKQAQGQLHTSSQILSHAKAVLGNSLRICFDSVRLISRYASKSTMQGIPSDDLASVLDFVLVVIIRK